MEKIFWRQHKFTHWQLMTWAPGDFPGRQMISGSIDVISNVILFFLWAKTNPQQLHARRWLEGEEQQ